MVIKSPFKDYYDHVAKIYGGGDPKIVYPRGRIASDYSFSGTIQGSPRLTRPNDFTWPGEEKYRRIGGLYTYGKDKVHRLYIVVAGKLYLLEKTLAADAIWHVDDVNKYTLGPLSNPYDNAENRKKWWWGRYENDVPFGVEHPFLIELSRKVGHPVFVIEKYSYYNADRSAEFEILGQCPTLSELGFSKIIRPEQMYQDLSYFVGNLIKPAPDTNPPVEVSNREKIKKAGFDLVTSFRHRK